MLDRDRSLILVRECFRAHRDVMKARIACEQRLRQRVIGQIYTSENGLFPEGGIEKAFDALKANDAVFAALKKEEAARLRELERALGNFDVFTKVFEPIEGVGPKIAARLIDAIGDIRRFKTVAQLCAFCGVHLTKDKEGNTVFPRRRTGQLANWHGDARQALYLLMDQWNRRPDSEWGKRFLANKAHFRKVHPEVEIVDGKKRYTKAHIHKMAGWRTATQFVEWLFGKWWSVADPARQKRAQRRHTRWSAGQAGVFGEKPWDDAPAAVRRRAVELRGDDGDAEDAMARAWSDWEGHWAPIFGDWWNSASPERKQKAVARFSLHRDLNRAIAEAAEIAA